MQASPAANESWAETLQELAAGLLEPATFWRLVGQLGGPALVAGVGYVIARKFVRFPIQFADIGLLVHRVREPFDPIFDLARTVYEGDKDRLPEDERTDWESKRAILREGTRVHARIFAFFLGEVMFLVGLRKGRHDRYHVASFLQFVKSHIHQTVFVSYYISVRPKKTEVEFAGDPNELTLLMLNALQRSAKSRLPFRGYYPIVGELEDPDEPGIDGGLARSRIRLFHRAARKGGYYMKEVAIPYIQPHVKLDDVERAKKRPLPANRDRHEKRMLLFLFSDEDRPHITKREFRRILAFITRLYVHAETEKPKIADYWRYLRDDWFDYLYHSMRGPDERTIKLRTLEKYLERRRKQTTSL